VSLGFHGVGGESSEVVRDGGGTSGEGEVWVGDVVVRMRGGMGEEVERWGVELGAKSKNVVDVLKSTGIGRVLNCTHHVQKLVRIYKSQMDDFKWARNGVVVTVFNGEAIQVVQNIIEDFGFTDLDIIPMGVDKVFISSYLIRML